MKNSIFVYCEITEEHKIADVSLELLTKGKKLATQLKVSLEAVVIADFVENVEELYKYGVDVIHLAQDKRLFPYLTLPHASIIIKLFQEQQPQIALFGASLTGRDLAPRVASALKCGLTADCTALEIGNYTYNKTGEVYNDLLFQIRPALGGNILATIINPDTRPQMATVREGVLKKEYFDNKYKGTINNIDVKNYIEEADFIVSILGREIENKKINIKNSQIIVAGGYGVGNKENFKKLHLLAELMGGEVGATRAAVDAGFAEKERQIGQTGVTVRPKLYFAFGISGAIQHRTGMEESAKIISVNTDPDAPINTIADYSITANLNDIIPLMIKFLKNRQ